MWVKICGVCRREDAAAAARAGADFVGVVLARGGPRSRTPDEAAGIFAAASDASAGGGRGPKRVGVFVDPAIGEVEAAVDALGLDVVQLHGAEPASFAADVRGAGAAVWKALRPRDRASFLAGLDAYGGVADALLLDGWSARAAGGAGVAFPWAEVAPVRHRVPASVRLIVAGGLTPGTVADAIRLLRPDGVDVSSGVERAPGEKDPDLVAAFVARARAAAAGTAAEDGTTRLEG